MLLAVKLKKIVLYTICISVTMSIVGVLFLHTNAEEGVKLPILMYHSILKDTARTGKYILTPTQLEQDIITLQQMGYKSVSADDVIRYVLYNEPLPEKPYLLTFDDGSYNNLTYVLPILEKHNAYAIISVVGSYSEKFSQTGETNPAYSYLKWEDISALVATGRVEIGNHSYNMHSIQNGRIGAAQARGESEDTYITKFAADCDRTQQLLEINSGIKPRIYTYPFGAYCDLSQKILQDSGYIMTLTCNEGINVLSYDIDCLKLMRRFNRPGGISSTDFFAKCGIR